MDSHKSTVLTLSLSVLTLAIISTFLSLNQSGVLGDTTSTGSAPAIRPTGIVVKPVENKIYGEVRGLFNNYCLRKNDQVDTGSADYSASPKQTNNEQPFDVRPENSGLGGVCGDLFKLTNQFCSTVIGGPLPTSVCKYGVNSFAVGTPCKTTSTLPGKEMALIYTEANYTSAKYSCYDGKEGTVSSPTSSCVTEGVLKNLARKACEGHGVCKNPEKPTGRPEEPKHCTGDKDCEINETCLLPTVVEKTANSTTDQPERLTFGKCVPRASATVGPRVTVYPRVSVNPKVSPIPSRTELTCTWCGTKCGPLVTNQICNDVVMIGKSCVNVGGKCTVVPSTTRTQ